MPSRADYARAQELTRNLILRELRSRYRRSVLGWTWSLLNPLATAAVFSVVFSVFLKIAPPVGDPSGTDNFALFLLCGILLWNFFMGGLNAGMGALVGNENLIKKVYFPREALVISAVASAGVTLLVELAVLSVVFLFVGNIVFLWWPVAALIVVLVGMIVLGLGLLLSVLNVYFRDTGYLIGILLQVWFYATPIVYPLYLVEETIGSRPTLDFIYRLNPMLHAVESLRDVFYHLRFPDPASMGYLLACGVVSMVVGWKVFNRREGRLAEEL